ncbi:Uncharacterised protein [Bordetella pertussis]|nr:Uncharacterised protein [Bordetella pertussis]CFP63941.1 Uncharacterised protein [Bordetella pertussis]CPN03962.1 Uncharacterised protein [Bordetella pertussis]
MERTSIWMPSLASWRRIQSNMGLAPAPVMAS